MVFIDGDHQKEAVLEDIEMWKPRCRKRLCGHDVTDIGVYRALLESGLFFSVVPHTSLWEVRIVGGGE
jgi:hypothetical protein